MMLVAVAVLTCEIELDTGIREGLKVICAQVILTISRRGTVKQIDTDGSIICPCSLVRLQIKTSGQWCTKKERWGMCIGLENAVPKESAAFSSVASAQVQSCWPDWRPRSIWQSSNSSGCTRVRTASRLLLEASASTERGSTVGRSARLSESSSSVLCNCSQV